MEIVIAGTYKQYQDYLRTSGKTPHEAIYACAEHHLLGRHSVQIVRVGQWWKNPIAKSDYLRMLEQEMQSV